MIDKTTYTSTGTSTWVDYAIDNSNPNVMVQCKFESKLKGTEWIYNINIFDYRTRRISLVERIRNWAILKLGGKLDRKYTSKFVFSTK